MSTRKRNEFLDADESEDEQGGYYSDEIEEGRGAIGGRANKRQRTEDVDSDDASFHSLEDEEEQQGKGEKQTSKTKAPSEGQIAFNWAAISTTTMSRVRRKPKMKSNPQSRNNQNSRRPNPSLHPKRPPGSPVWCIYRVSHLS